MRHIEGVTNRQLLLDSGLGHDAIDAMLVRGDVTGLARGVYLERGAPDDRRRRLIAALLTIGAPVVVTDADSLWVRGHIDEPAGPIDVMLPHPRNPARPGWVRMRTSTRFAHCDQVRVGIIPVVCEAWALTDAAKTHSRRALAKLVTRAIAARWVKLDGLEQVLEVRGVFPGSGKMRRLIEEIKVDHPYSGTERRLAKRCRLAGLSLILNTAVDGPGGEVVARGDLCFPELKLIVEVDGPHHWLPEVAAADRVRDRRLRALGWNVVRFTVYEIDEDIEAVVREIIRTIETIQAQQAA